MDLFKKYRNSFQVKVIFVSIFFMLLTCISLTIYYVRIFHASHNEALIGRAQMLSSILASSAKVGIFSENINLLRDPIGGVAEHQEVLYVAIFNASGELLLKKETPKAAVSEPVFQASGDIEDELIAKLRQSISPIYIPHRNSLDVWSTVFSSAGYTDEKSLFFEDNRTEKKDSVIGFAHIVISKERLNNEILSFIHRAILIAMVAIIVGSVVILYFIRGITNPLRQLTHGIKKLGDQGEAEKIFVDSEDEIGKLAIAFNEMSESLLKKKAENLSLEMQLRQIQKLEALGTLAGGIAHDFNNVLSPIIGFTEMAMEDLSEKDVVFSDLKEVLNAAIRAKDLVKQILAFSRQSESERVPLKIQLIIKEALSLLRATLPATINIRHRINNDCKPMMADPVDIHRIIMNLGTNAFHAMPEQKGILQVILENCTLTDKDLLPAWGLSPGRYLKLTVSDTGTGMDKATMQKIFDPYFTTKLQGKGTGMGLAVVHGIVKSYNGDIQVKSELGKGSIFLIYLPAIEREKEISKNLELDEIQGGDEHILLVDDEIQIVHMLKQMLTKLGYKVTARTSSIEALEAFSSNPTNFDLVITDLTMPNMTGDELAVALMNICSDIPVIICTGFSEKITDDIARRKGIRALLMKPVIKREMARTIREVVGACEKQNDKGS